jgi:Zn/Cd-binding protein ZinT
MKTQVARAAQMIRRELKETYPTVKFSVRSQSYSMGDSIDVTYTDGPLSKDVEEITNKYQAGSFNGMEDIYEFDNRNADLPQTKYLFVTRNASEATESMIQFYIASKHPQQPDNMHVFAWGQFIQQEFRTEFNACEYPEKIHNNEIAA